MSNTAHIRQFCWLKNAKIALQFEIKYKNNLLVQNEINIENINVMRTGMN